MVIKLSYQEYLGLNDQEYDEFLKLEKEEETIAINDWLELRNCVINGHKFMFMGEDSTTMTVLDMSGLPIGTFYLNRSKTGAIEGYLMEYGIYIMVCGRNDE